jgi:hypothetical protein
MSLCPLMESLSFFTNARGFLVVFFVNLILEGRLYESGMGKETNGFVTS